MAKKNTWEGLENLKNVMEKIEEFKKGRFEEEIWRIRVKKEKEMKLNLEEKSYQEDIQRSCYMDGMIRNLMKNIRKNQRETGIGRRRRGRREKRNI